MSYPIEPPGNYPTPPPGNYPTPPPGNYPSTPWEPVPQGPPPAPVVNAVRAIFASVTLSLIGVVVTLMTQTSMRAQIVKTQPTLTPDMVNTAMTIAVVVAVVFGIVSTVLYVALALLIRAGKNWARIVAFVLFGLGAFFGLISLAQPAAAISRGLGLVSLVLDVAIIVLLAQRRATEYFTRRR